MPVRTAAPPRLARLAGALAAVLHGSRHCCLAACCSTGRGQRRLLLLLSLLLLCALLVGLFTAACGTACGGCCSKAILGGRGNNEEPLLQTGDTKASLWCTTGKGCQA